MRSSIVDQADLSEPASKRAHGSSFYAAMRIMPPAQREAMFEIYSFCRAVDDIADDQSESAPRLSQLNQWRQDLASIYRGNVPAHLNALNRSIRQFDLQQADFLAIIDGMEMDVQQNIQAPDLATLDIYCDRVASAVGRLSVRVFGLPEEDGKALSHHLGRALQLTNILRDLDEDAAIHRLYLPREYLTSAGIQAIDPDTVLSSLSISQVCDKIVASAKTHFEKADRIMATYPKRVIRTPKVMSDAYKTILEALTSRGWASPRHPIRLSKSRLGLILLRHFILG